MADTALALIGVTAGYGNSTVLHDVNLAVAPHQVAVLLGANGAGKTTLLRVASGLLSARTGTVTLSGTDVTQLWPSRRARAGACLIPEGRGVFPDLTVRDNLQLQIPRHGSSARLDDALTIFPALRDRLGTKAGRLSGGQQQMVALARSWLASPSVVMLDEVSMGLAPLLVDEIFEALRALAAAGTALLLVEQYVDKALEMADVAYLLQKGRIEYEGPARGLDRDALLESYLGLVTEAG